MSQSMQRVRLRQCSAAALVPPSRGRGLAAQTGSTSGHLAEPNVKFNKKVVRGSTWAASTLSKLKEGQKQPSKSPKCACRAWSGTWTPPGPARRTRRPRLLAAQPACALQEAPGGRPQVRAQQPVRRRVYAPAGARAHAL